MVLKLTKLTTTQGPSLNLKVTHLHPPPRGWGYTCMLTWLALTWVLGILIKLFMLTQQVLSPLKQPQVSSADALDMLIIKILTT